MSTQLEKRVNAELIPAVLRARPQWVLWKGKKVPYQTDGEPADSTDPETWSTFEAAYAEYLTGRYGGIGYVFSEDDPYCGIDIDKCRDAETGTFNEVAEASLVLINSYSEVSPSGIGIHIIAEASLPDGCRHKDGNLECYDQGRYFTFTGHHIEGTPLDVMPSQDAVTEWVDTRMPKRLEAPAANILQPALPSNVIQMSTPDDVLLEKARNAHDGGKFASLFYHGDYSGYPSQSEADQALCNKLAFWWQRDAIAIDRMFRQSKLFREKWDKRRGSTTYGANTIQNAIAFTTTVYEPKQQYDRAIVTIGGKRKVVEQVEAAEFPVGALPAILRDFAVEGSQSNGAPVDFFALPLLVAAGAAIGLSYELRLKNRWVLRSNLWGATVGVPGSGKTPAQDLALEALVSEQVRRTNVYDKAKKVYDDELAEYDNARKDVKPQKPVMPTLRSLLTTDSTIEGLIDALTKRNGILLKFDELNSWIGALNQYKGGKGNDREQMLSGWSNSPMFKLRVGRQLMVERPHLSIIGGIQPRRLHVLQTDGDDGLFARFLWSYPEAEVLDWDEAEVSDRAANALAMMFMRLVDGAENEPMTVQFTPNAKTLWVSWYNNRAAEQRKAGFPEALQGTWSKLDTQAGRIALAIHAVSDGSDTLSRDTLERAFAITDYFALHSQRVSNAMSGPDEPFLKRLHDALLSAGKVTKTSLMNDVFNRNIPASKIEDGLETLKQLGRAVNETDTTGGRGRPAEYWRPA